MTEKVMTGENDTSKHKIFNDRDKQVEMTEKVKTG